MFLNTYIQNFEKRQILGVVNKMLKFQFLTKNIFLFQKSLRNCKRIEAHKKPQYL